MVDFIMTKCAGKLTPMDRVLVQTLGNHFRIVNKKYFKKNKMFLYTKN